MTKDINPYQSPKDADPNQKSGELPPRLSVGRGALGLGLGTLYFLILFGMGILGGGAGHGTFFFAAVMLSPFSMANDTSIVTYFGFGLWPMVGLIASMRRVRYVLVGLLLAHYFGIPFVLLDELRHGSQYLQRSDAWALWLPIYLIGQIALWFRVWKTKS